MITAGEPSPESLLPSHGGYRKLKSFQVAQLVYDVTAHFRDRHIERRSRTHDQMVQAARSGLQNIAEGSQASGTSKKMELKLTNVARASLEELRLDYEDYLRQRGLTQWERQDPRLRRCWHCALPAWMMWCNGRSGSRTTGQTVDEVDRVDTLRPPEPHPPRPHRPPQAGTPSS